MNPLGDADAVERLAARCDADAGWLEEIGRRWEQRLADARWACAKADRFRAVVAARQADARHHADDLRQLALDLRRHARWIRTRTQELVNLEHRVRAWFAQNTAVPGTGISIWAQWGVHPSFPGPAHPDWEDLASRLRRFGAIL